MNGKGKISHKHMSVNAPELIMEEPPLRKATLIGMSADISSDVELILLGSTGCNSFGCNSGNFMMILHLLTSLPLTLIPVSQDFKLAV